MRLIRNHASQPPAGGNVLEQGIPWKVLVIDDEEDVHNITRLSLKRMKFAGRGVELLCVFSAAQARAILETERDIAVALIDVVMESDTAGLDLVEYIRHDLNNPHIRLIIRTGQPGIAPERQVIDHYDIDDYKDKTELTAQKLYTTIRTALKAYQDLGIIEQNRRGLEYILEATPGLYLPHIASCDEFFRGVLTQIVSLCKLGENCLMSTVNSLVGTMDHPQPQIRAGTGIFSAENADERLQDVLRICSEAVMQGRDARQAGLPENSLLLPLRNGGPPLGFIFWKMFPASTRMVAICCACSPINAPRP
jgi:CheY-like chemotaxis protein